MRKESPGAVRTPFIPCVRRLQELRRVFYDRGCFSPSAAFGGLGGTLCAQTCIKAHIGRNGREIKGRRGRRAGLREDKSVNWSW